MYRILSLDGGGVRSLFTARLIERLEYEKPLLQNADMLAGNSGGAILAAALACGLSPTQVVELFVLEGQQIFSDSWRDNTMDLFDLKGAKYEARKRKRIFERYFGTKRLSDFSKAIVLTAFDLKHRSGRWQPISFHNFADSRYRHLSFTDAVMASSAAPTYFPIYRIGGSKFVDGGVWANNPSMAALTEALHAYRGGQDFEQVVILNIGTLLEKVIFKGAKNDLGIYDWVRGGLIDLILDSAAMDAIAYYCQGLLGVRYFRLNELTSERLSMDDVSKIQRLLDIADGIDLKPVLSWMEGFWA